MSRKVCLLAAFTVATSLILLAGCRGDTPKDTTTTSDVFKAAHESIANLRTVIAQGNPRATQRAVNAAGGILSSLPQWIHSDGKGNVEERTKAIQEASIMLGEEVAPLAEQGNAAKANPKLDEVDSLITKAEQ